MDEFTLPHFVLLLVVNAWCLESLKWKKSQIFRFYVVKTRTVDDERLDEIEQKAQAKNTNSRNDARKEKLQWI